MEGISHIQNIISSLRKFQVIYIYIYIKTCHNIGEKYRYRFLESTSFKNVTNSKELRTFLRNWISRPCFFTTDKPNDFSEEGLSCLTSSFKKKKKIKLNQIEFLSPPPHFLPRSKKKLLLLSGSFHPASSSNSLASLLPFNKSSAFLFSSSSPKPPSQPPTVACRMEAQSERVHVAHTFFARFGAEFARSVGA